MMAKSTIYLLWISVIAFPSFYVCNLKDCSLYYCLLNSLVQSNLPRFCRCSLMYDAIICIHNQNNTLYQQCVVLFYGHVLDFETSSYLSCGIFLIIWLKGDSFGRFSIVLHSYCILALGEAYICYSLRGWLASSLYFTTAHQVLGLKCRQICLCWWQKFTSASACLRDAVYWTGFIFTVSCSEQIYWSCTSWPLFRR